MAHSASSKCADKLNNCAKSSSLVSVVAAIADVCNASTMLQQCQKYFHQISDEMDQWREILEIPYQEYLPNK
jgi:hypothetical protein